MAGTAVAPVSIMLSAILTTCVVFERDDDGIAGQ